MNLETLTCSICAERIRVPLITAAGAPRIGEAGREAVEYQAAAVEFVKHCCERHPEYVQVFAMTAQTYQLHLIAKMLNSDDPEFEKQREAARELCYWTLSKGLLFSPVLEGKAALTAQN